MVLESYKKIFIDQQEYYLLKNTYDDNIFQSKLVDYFDKLLKIIDYGLRFYLVELILDNNIEKFCIFMNRINKYKIPSYIRSDTNLDKELINRCILKWNNYFDLNLNTKILVIKILLDDKNKDITNDLNFFLNLVKIYKNYNNRYTIILDYWDIKSKKLINKKIIYNEYFNDKNILEYISVSKKIFLLILEKTDIKIFENKFGIISTYLKLEKIKELIIKNRLMNKRKDFIDDLDYNGKKWLANETIKYLKEELMKDGSSKEIVSKYLVNNILLKLYTKDIDYNLERYDTISKINNDNKIKSLAKNLYDNNNINELKYMYNILLYYKGIKKRYRNINGLNKFELVGNIVYEINNI